MKHIDYIKPILIHILIGVVIYVLPALSKIYLIGIIIYFSLKILKSQASTRVVQILKSCAYVVGSEVFIRMTGGTLFYETSKYLVILFCLIGLFTVKQNNQSIPYIVYILLLVPGLFVAGFNITEATTLRTSIAFNLSGPVCLGVASIFCYKLRVSYKESHSVFLSMVLPLITTTSYLFLYNPSVRDTVTGTSANFAASGGFGPNQVATVLGLGMFIFSIRFFSQSTSFFLKVINIILLFVLSYRGIVTFSRGGIITAMVMIVAFIYLYFKKVNRRHKFRVSRLLLVFVGLGLSIWLYSSLQTSGLIENRYANKDALGRQKKDISTGRAGLVAFEINEFLKNPVLGVGVGKIKELRQERQGITAASHNEISRILSEHGLFGVGAFLILIFTPLFYRVKNKSNMYFYSCYLFWLLTINHSAMRIAAPAFLYALCLLNITYEKHPVHRKQVKG